MAIKTEIIEGGAAAATVFDFTDQIPLWDLNESGGHTSIFDTGMAYGNGTACQWQLQIIDDAGDLGEGTDTFLPHHVVTVSEDAPGYDAWLGRGRLSRFEVTQDAHPLGRTHTLTVDDANMDLRGLALPDPWVRGSESGRARVLAAITAFLTGDPRLTTVIENDLVATGGEVTMPAKTYPAGTEVNEILEDCATSEGKVFGVVIHHDAGASHLCLLYVDDADHTTYVSNLAITDTAPDLTNSFPPIWDQGASFISDGQELTTGVVSRYGIADQTVFVEDTADVDRYDYWVVSYNDTASMTAAQASDRADAIRHSRSIGHPTLQASIKIPASLVDQLCAGMSIDITAANISNSTLVRRIVQLKWEPVAPEVGAVEGYYIAHMQLDRPMRILPEPPGIVTGPTAITPETLWEAAICAPNVLLTTGTWLVWLTSATGLAVTGTVSTDYDTYGSGLLRVVQIYSVSETVSITAGFIMALKVPDKEAGYYVCA